MGVLNAPQEGVIMESRGNALIFYGGWDGHEPDAVAKRFQKMLEKHGYHCEVCEGQDMLSDRERLMQMDLIVPCFTMGRSRQNTVIISGMPWRQGAV